ncbi:class I adenylate-forming enzyme family protein [Alkalihalobacterium elongatum]|uniref:class I adenylate-forming enzyme family protein n=1 Tax=Alkalihalobacterium elongatum TaxID=2675466 RepID=UPI001C1F4CAA|nr:long-chain fatty acid--CoA ligase [Alkalihalobacterium elongatum]
MSWDTDWFANRARITPDRVAVVNGETNENWTYEQLNTRAENLASALKERGINKRDRVALLSPNHVCYFDLLFACAKLGAIFVPLNWRLASHELAFILEDCQPKLLIFDEKLEELITPPFQRVAIKLNGSEYSKWLLEKGVNQPANVESYEPLAIIYTGGTTGKPKGAVLTHRAIFSNIINTITSWNLKAEDTTLTYLPMFHTGGLNALSLPLLHMGGKVVIADQFDPEEAIRMLNDHQCSIVLFVPTMYHMLIETEGFQFSLFPTMHTFLSGGAPCSYKIYEAFASKRLQFKEGYGLTEAGPNNFYIDPDKVKDKQGSVGKPMLYNKVRIINEVGKDVAPGEVGEIILSGHHVFDHYWNRPDATAEAIRDGWLYTGDLGKRDEDGYHYIVGRKKDMIITGGENVYPLEIEHIIAEHEHVAEVAVVGVSDEKWGEVVAAFIVPKKGHTLLVNEIEKHCRRYLGGYKIPRRIHLVPELPKTPVGKIDKKEIIKSSC